jgi:hypothetical protein
MASAGKLTSEGWAGGADLSEGGARTMATARDRDRCIAAATAELAGVSDHLEAQLRERHPELFDRRGRLKQRMLTKLLIEQAGKEILTKADLVEDRERLGGVPRTVHA